MLRGRCDCSCLRSGRGLPIKLIVNITGVAGGHGKVAIYRIIGFDSPVDQVIDYAAIDYV